MLHIGKVLPMPAPSSEPLQKLSLNLFASDVAKLKTIYGSGYQTEIREIVHTFLKERVEQSQSRVTAPFHGDTSE